MPVRDLTQADFEVLEDGVPQTIGSFTPVFEDVGEPAPTPRRRGGAARRRPRSAPRRR